MKIIHDFVFCVKGNFRQIFCRLLNLGNVS